ncbi:hypothetical protein LTS15_004037 [Exophiala xenobiotica]|nr:hypothetical protein LTS15_004037 [Exophiala xenobiotica]
MKTPTNPSDVVQATPPPVQIDVSPDELQLRAQGHVSELPRQFGAFATLSLAFSITNSWVGFSAVFATPLLAGGGPTIFFGLIVATIACSFITAGLAELASAFPSSGGQYHYAFMVSSPKYRAATAFTVGWLSVIAWCLITATAAVFCAQIVGNIASFLHPDYVWTQWQIYLIYVLLCTVAVAVVIWLPRQIPMLEKVFFMASIVGFVVFFITVLATSKGKQSASTVFTKWDNQTGWSDGTAFLLGVGTYYGATIGCFLAAGRQTWSFARDNGLSHSKIFAKIHPTLQVPVNATLTTLIFCVLYGLIYIGSTTAYNSFINLSILSLNITYAIPQAVVVIRGRDKVLPKRQFNLGPVLGPICNIFSVIWMLVFTVLFCFPVFLPVTLQNMNYLSVVVAAVCLFILILWWGGKRKTFEGPHIELPEWNL